jgi:4'-phosphopantetheinyl transferase
MPADAWFFDVDLPLEDIAALHAVISRGERIRAGQFRFARDRNRFIARRGRLRLLLASYLGVAAADVVYTQNAFGKPAVAGDGELSFSLSHSHGLAMCAIAWEREVGCDLEWCDDELASRETAERLFSPVERRRLAALPPEQWREGFYNCWTRKEAFVKALGLGLAHPLDSFDVAVEPGQPAALLSPAAGWSMRGFAPRPSYLAAVVVAGDEQAVRFRGTIPWRARSAA